MIDSAEGRKEGECDRMGQKEERRVSVIGSDAVGCVRLSDAFGCLDDVMLGCLNGCCVYREWMAAVFRKNNELPDFHQNRDAGPGFVGWVVLRYRVIDRDCDRYRVIIGDCAAN